MVGWGRPQNVTGWRDPVSGSAGSAAQPERGTPRPHGLVHDAHDIVGDGLEVDLIPEAGDEPCRRRLRVRAPPVEPAVDGTLDPPPDWLEDAEGDQGRGGHRDRLLLGERA